MIAFNLSSITLSPHQKLQQRAIEPTSYDKMHVYLALQVNTFDNFQPKKR
jgi:hypothetical protein